MIIPIFRLTFSRYDAPKVCQLNTVTNAKGLMDTPCKNNCAGYRHHYHEQSDEAKLRFYLFNLMICL